MKQKLKSQLNQEYDFTERKPEPFDLIEFTSPRGKKFVGWWTGHAIDGLNVQQNAATWRRIKDHQ